ncbi:swr complex subunit [Mortierella claussenii]|nr:swr complex subunit [Mortierella claussenii]
MATGNDIREIFQLKPADQQVKRIHKTEKKPGMCGISRELYGLIGNNVSTVAFNNPTYKPKLNVSKKAVNWTWRPFMNPSRDDDLILHHWEKTRTDPNEEYRFYKFNKAIDTKEFSPEEYRAHLQDPDWTLEETNYLWDLCRRFDLRWVVIQDRYEWPPQDQDRLALRYYNGNMRPGVETTTAPISGDSTITNGPEPRAMAVESTATTTMAVNPLPTAASTDPTTSETATPVPITNMDGIVATGVTASATPAEEAHSNTSVATPANTSTTATAPAATEIVKFTPAKTRSMEDLKDRYYTVNRILIRVRTTDPSQAVEKAQLLSSMAYDKDREVERKKNLEILNTRTPEQIEEEEALYLEARRIDQNEKKITRERESLLRLLNTRDIYGPGGPVSAGLAGQVASGGGPGTGIIIPSNSITIPSSSSTSSPSTNGPLSPSIGKNASNSAAAAASSATAPAAPVKKRKKAPKGSTQAEEPVSTTAAASNVSATASSSATKGSSSSNRRPSNASTSTSNDGSSSSSNLPQGVQVKKEKLTPGAYLRSQKMTPIVSTKQQRVTTTLTQLGLPIKPAMPTATVMAKWDQLNSNVVTLLDLKKQVDKLESDLKVVKMRRGSASGVGLFSASTTGLSTAGAGGAGATAGVSGGATGAGAAGSAGADSNFGVKREGTADEAGAPGQVKKKKRKE